jgi:hypothetical protein
MCSGVFCINHIESQGIIFINNEHQLNRFAAIALLNQCVARGARILHIKLNHISSESIRMLKQLLSRTQAITDLTLILPHHPPRLFRNLRYSKIVLFKTNIPHAAIEGFLRRHPHIRYLDLGPCHLHGRRRDTSCPLENVPFPSLGDLTCPPACTVMLQAPEIARVRAADQGTRMCGPILPAFQVLGGRLFEGAALTVLHLDFDPADLGLLRCIANAVPSLTALKLTEQCHAVTVTSLF